MAYGDNKTKKELIDEIYGLGFTPDMSHLHTKLDDPWKSSGLDRGNNYQKRTAASHECKFQMRDWQIQVYQTVLQGGNAIVAVPPAAGKTLPVTCAWKQKLVEALSKPVPFGSKIIPEMPRIAFVVPTQQLAMQIGKQDFLRDENSGLLRMFANNPEIFQKFFRRRTNIYTSIQGKKFEEKRDPITGQKIMFYKVSPLVNIKTKRIVTDPSGIRDDREIVPLFKIDERNQIKPNPDPTTKMPFIDPTTGRPYNLKKYEQIVKQEETNIRLTQQDITELFKMLDQNFIAVLTGGESASVVQTRGLLSPIKPIVVGTYNPMEKVISQYGKYFDVVVIDETQEFIGRPGENFIGKDFKEKQESFVKIIKSTPRTTSLFLLTGSTNGGTLTSIKDLLDSTENRNIKLIMPNLPSSQRNRSQINIMPFDKMQTFIQLKDLCSEIITTKQTNSIMLLFSLKRTAQTGILRIMEEIIPNLPIINKEYYNKKQFLKEKPNSDKLRIINDRILRTEEYLRNLEGSDQEYEKKRKNALQRLKILNKLKDQSITTKIIVKGKEGISIGISNVDDYDKYISQLGNPVTPGQLADIHASDFIDTEPPEQIGNIGKEFSDIEDIEFLKYFDIRALEEKGKRNHVLDSPDSNNLLYQGVLRGMGIMTGSMHQRHKETIQKLFKVGKIPLLFASDALGVGANVKCKYLYIPKLMKFQDGGGFGQIDPSSLVQLVNRAGRGAFDVAYVYCNSSDFDEVKTMIQEDPKTSVDQVSEVPFGSLVELFNQKGEKEALKWIPKLLSGNR